MFRDRRKFFLIVAVLALFVLISVPFSFTRPIRAIFTSTAAPILKLSQGVYRRVVLVVAVIFTSDNPYTQAREAEEKAKEAHAEIIMLKGRVQRLSSLSKQVGELESTNYRFIPCTIIGREPTRWYNSALLNKGSRSGVAVGQPVVAGNNFVGRIIDVGRRWSRVRFVIDPSSSIPGQLKDSGYIGEVTGASINRLKMDHINKEAVIKPGEVVVTACFTDPDARIRSILPPGFVIGKIVSVDAEQDGWRQAAYIEPVVDFKKLGTVLIVKTE